MRDRTEQRGSLLVFSDDWGRHPSSCQHLVQCLLPRYEVHWVNTIGTRKPSLSLATLSRGLEKLRHWTRRGAGPVAPPNLHIHNPRMWPSFSGFGRKLNRELLVRQLAPLVRRLPAPVIALTTLPLVADLVGLLPVARWVYYCVDDFSVWPGLDQITLREMERRLVERADALIAVSETLQRQLEEQGRRVHLLTHGVDTSFWLASGPRQAAPELADCERPLALFWGCIDRRMDVSFMQRLAHDMTSGTIVLVGPEDNPEPALWQNKRLHKVGAVALERLPNLARDADVLIMPYADLPVTRAIQPLKLKEYLATGKPVVVRDLPATRPWSDCLDVSNSAESFSALVRRRMVEGVPAEQRCARNRLVSESWPAKARALEQWALDEVLAACG